MRILFENAAALMGGISLVAPDLGFEVVTEAADLTVTVTEVPAREVTVTLDGSRATIAYGEGKARFFRGLATLMGWLKAGITQKSATERPLFRTNGAMVDMSRNAVMNVKTVKEMLRRMALMGLNTYMLYTEDTYEIEEYPYFGHLRGRYTKAEIRELDAYAMALGIELVPCIQMLGHLSTHLRWPAAKPYQDTGEALLVGADATHQLLEAMLSAIADCFTSRRLHVGMDETHDLGTGKYMRLHGYRDRQEIYFEHLSKVIEMSRAHGFTPMMWSDMFFRLAGRGLQGYKDYDMRVQFTDEVIAKVPSGIQPVFWDYYNAEEAFYATNIEKHVQLFGELPLFAGGVWTWSGFGPLYSRSLSFTIPALDACRKARLQEIFATIWHNGAEGSLILGLAGLAWYADYDYTGGYDADSMKRCFRNACGVDYDTTALCELVEHPDATPEAPNGSKYPVTRPLVYGDPLCPISDKHFEGMDLQSYYRGVVEKMTAAEDKGLFAPAFDTVLRVAELLTQKADFGLRLRAAYKGGEKATLAALAAECDSIAERIKALRESHRKSWLTYNKPFGWEVFDIRYGGLLMRFDTAKERIRAYLSGELSAIEELEAPSLRLDGTAEDDPRLNSGFLWGGYQKYATVSKI